MDNSTFARYIRTRGRFQEADIKLKDCGYPEAVERRKKADSMPALSTAIWALFLLCCGVLSACLVDGSRVAYAIPQRWIGRAHLCFAIVGWDFWRGDFPNAVNRFRRGGDAVRPRASVLVAVLIRSIGVVRKDTGQSRFPSGPLNAWNSRAVKPM